MTRRICASVLSLRAASSNLHATSIASLRLCVPVERWRRRPAESVKQAIQFLVSGRRRNEAILPYNKTYNVKAVNHVIVVFSSLVAELRERLNYNRGFESLPHRQTLVICER